MFFGYVNHRLVPAAFIVQLRADQKQQVAHVLTNLLKAKRHMPARSAAALAKTSSTQCSTLLGMCHFCGFTLGGGKP